MSEVRIVIREADRDWSGTIHGGSADCAIAALSADPTTLTELESACARYEKPSPHAGFFSCLTSGLNDEPYDAGLVLIDLAARLVVVDSTYSAPGPKGDVTYHDGRSSTNIRLPYALADDWQFLNDRFSWTGQANQRRREQTARPPLNVRAVTYGRPMLEFIARETFAAYARQPKASETDDSKQTYETLKDIHAAWLMTLRDDLRGQTPREVSFVGHEHISRDLHNQQMRWSRLDECPPTIDQESLAFRCGGFGTHELVEYYELVRDLLWSCWNHLAKTETARPAAFTVGDFLSAEITRLEQVREAWLDGPDPECHLRTPRSIIDREHMRLPEAVSGRDAMVDPDCPCCQMMADMPGPVFWHLDGCNMDEGFAFDIYHRTCEEWEAEQQELDEFNRRFDAEQKERKRLGVSEYGPDRDTVWLSSFVVDDAADIPLGVRLFGIGGRLAELIADLRRESESCAKPSIAQPMIARLNRDFGNLRKLLQNSDAPLASALLEPVRDRFVETLAEIASVRADLAAKSESLTEGLARFLSPAAQMDDYDFDVPF